MSTVKQFSLRRLIFPIPLWTLILLTYTASAQNYPSFPHYEARPLAFGASVLRQPVGPRMDRLSGNNYFADWNFTPNFAVEGKFEQASTPPCNSTDNQIMSYKAYEVGIQGSFSAGPLRPSATGYFGSGWVNRRESGVLWHEPNTMLLGIKMGVDVNLTRGTTARLSFQSTRWIPFWLGTTNQNMNYVSFGLVHRLNSSFGHEWR